MGFLAFLTPTQLGKIIHLNLICQFAQLSVMLFINALSPSLLAVAWSNWCTQPHREYRVMI